VPAAPRAVPEGPARTRRAGRLVAGPVRRGEPLTDVRLLGAALLPRAAGRRAGAAAEPATAALVQAGDVDVLAADAERRRRPRVWRRGCRAAGAARRRPGGGAAVVVVRPPSAAARLAAAAVTGRLSVACARPMSTYAVWGLGRRRDEPAPRGPGRARCRTSRDDRRAGAGPAGPAPLPELPPSRRLPRCRPSLRALASDDPVDRARHAFGRSYRDLVRAMAGQVDSPPDLVLRPATSRTWSTSCRGRPRSARRSCPFGGGSSVVGGRRAARAGRRRQPRPVAAGRPGGGRRDLARGAAAGRHVRPAARPPQAARPDAALLPAVLRALTVGGWVATRAPATSPPGSRTSTTSWSRSAR
jgi:hypothetical protein